ERAGEGSPGRRGDPPAARGRGRRPPPPSPGARSAGRERRAASRDGAAARQDRARRPQVRDDAARPARARRRDRRRGARDRARADARRAAQRGLFRCAADGERAEDARVGKHQIGAISVAATLASILDVSHVGYPLLYLMVMAESAGFLVPGETALITAAVLASQGKLEIELVIALAATAAIVGDNIGYVIGR